jgi:peptidoglycan hydrolase-like protein with peptidoglycan-binding domain
MTETKTTRTRSRSRTAKTKEEPAVQAVEGKELDIQRWAISEYELDDVPGGETPTRDILLKALKKEVKLKDDAEMDWTKCPEVFFGSPVNHVKFVQGLLFLKGRSNIPFDGIFTPTIRGAVENWQITHKFSVIDGIAGPVTFESLFA